MQKIELFDKSGQVELLRYFGTSNMEITIESHKPIATGIILMKLPKIST